MAAVDKTFGGRGEPAVYAEAVTPSDTDDLVAVSRALYIGGAGDVVVTMLGGGDVTFKAVPVGTILPIRVSRVKAATGATYIISLS
jgi:hypothetical protein